MKTNMAFWARRTLPGATMCMSAAFARRRTSLTDLVEPAFAHYFERVLADVAWAMIAKRCSLLYALDGYAGRGKRANLHVRPSGALKVFYAGTADPLEHTA